jgi:hypothetical protein
MSFPHYRLSKLQRDTLSKIDSVFESHTAAEEDDAELPVTAIIVSDQCSGATTLLSRIVLREFERHLCRAAPAAAKDTTIVYYGPSVLAAQRFLLRFFAAARNQATAISLNTKEGVVFDTGNGLFVLRCFYGIEFERSAPANVDMVLLDGIVHTDQIYSRLNSSAICGAPSTLKVIAVLTMQTEEAVRWASSHLEEFHGRTFARHWSDPPLMAVMSGDRFLRTLDPE